MQVGCAAFIAFGRHPASPCNHGGFAHNSDILCEIDVPCKLSLSSLNNNDAKIIPDGMSYGWLSYR